VTSELLVLVSVVGTVCCEVLFVCDIELNLQFSSWCQSL